jgi:hypothetical protein
MSRSTIGSAIAGMTVTQSNITTSRSMIASCVPGFAIAKRMNPGSAS